MAFSDVNICNLALSGMGVNAISALTESSKTAIEMNRVWEYARTMCIEDVKPTFARSTATLAQDATYEATPTNPKFDHRYTKPASSFQITRVMDEGDSDVTDWVLMGDYIYTNTDNDSYDLMCEYIVDSTVATKWTGAFIACMVAKLKVLTCKQLAAMSSDKFEAEYERAVLRAIALNQSFDAVKGEQGNTDWIDRSLTTSYTTDTPLED